MFQAQFIRNLIREELEDMNERIHTEFWDIKMLVLKQVFLLEVMSFQVMLLGQTVFNAGYISMSNVDWGIF